MTRQVALLLLFSVVVFVAIQFNVALAQTEPQPTVTPGPAVTPVPPWPMPTPSPSTGGWKGLLMMLAAGAITSMGAAGVRYGMDKAGKKLPGEVMPAVVIGSGIGLTFLNAWLNSKGMPSIPMPPPEVVTPAVTGLAVGGTAWGLHRTVVKKKKAGPVE